MRSIKLFILLLTSMISFSQKRVSTKKYPYQVLFANQVSVFGKDVSQFDYLANNDLIDVQKNATIFHYSGKVFELSKGSYWMSDLVKEKPRRSFRPMLDSKGAFSIDPRKLYGGGCNPNYDESLQLVLPKNIVDLKSERNDRIELCWVLGKNLSYKIDYTFEIEFKNIYDDTLGVINTKEYFYDFYPNDLDTLENDEINLDDGYLILSISVKNHPNLKTEDIGIRLVDADKITESNETDYYFGLLEAVFYEYFNETRKAKALYQYQVRKSNQDPRFIQLYEDFLVRNPQFEANTE